MQAAQPAPGRDRAAVRRPAASKGPPAEGEKGTGQGPAHRRRDASGPRTWRCTGTPRGAAADVTGRPRARSASPPTWPNRRLGGRRSPTRRAARCVSFYDYRSDSYVTRTVDLGTGKVESTDTQHGVQPPPSHAEAVEAARLLIAAPLGRGPEGRTTGTPPGKRPHLARTRSPLSGFVYRGRAEARRRRARWPTAGSTAVSALFTKVKNGRGSTPGRFVIDLSARTVARLG